MTTSPAPAHLCRPALAGLERTEPAAGLGIEDTNSFRLQLARWFHQGDINTIEPALCGSPPASGYALVGRLRR
jgi:hypothetical protein